MKLNSASSSNTPVIGRTLQEIRPYNQTNSDSNSTAQSTTSFQPSLLSPAKLLSTASDGLGNQIFRFAAALGIASRTGRTFVTHSSDANWMVRSYFKITVRQLRPNVSWKLNLSVFLAANSCDAIQVVCEFQSCENFHFMQEEIRNQLLLYCIFIVLCTQSILDHV